MTELKEYCIKYARKLLSLYFIERDAEALFACAEKDAQLIGLEGRIMRGMPLVGSYRMEMPNLSVRVICEDAAEVTGSLTVWDVESSKPRRVEVTMLLKERKEELRLVRMHLSCHERERFSDVIAEERRFAQTMRETIALYERIIDLAGAIIFEWDITQDLFSLSFRWTRQFGHPLPDEGDGVLQAFAAHVHPDDLPVLHNAMEAAWRGADKQDLELRIADRAGRYSWCRVITATAFNEKGEPVSTMGFITDIDGQKKDTLRLRDRAEKDALTGLYNKMTAQHMADRYLQDRPEERMDALLVLDIDNFKHVNDTYGHLFGDTMLADISGRIRRIFRSSDIVGRIGGDEFMILLKEIPSAMFAAQKGQQVLDLFSAFMKEKEVEEKLSCSIGIALAPNHGRGYDALFRAADTALYRAKEAGKNQIALYSEE